MKFALVRVWIDGDDIPSIQYSKRFKGRDVTAHNRFIREAQRKFPNWKRIETEAI